MMGSILVTGATGFVGSAILKRLKADGVYMPIAAVRSQLSTTKSLPPGTSFVQVNELTADTNWSTALTGVSVVLHAAARVHVMKEVATDPLSEFRRVNVEGTLKLARQASQMGVKRFVFVSSIGVNGAETYSTPFNETSEPKPHSSYALSKWEAEEGLRRLATEKEMEVVIIRPPLVYGPGAPGNFDRMLRVVAKGIPLPLGAIHNRRSLVAVENLVDLILTCIEHPAAANQTFLVSDDDDLSTSDLLRQMATALGKPARLIPIPVMLLKAGAALLGERDIAQRLLGSLQVDISKTKEVLNWTPPVSVDEALKKTADDFLARQKH